MTLGHFKPYILLYFLTFIKIQVYCWCQWLMLVILFIHEVEIGRIEIWGHPRQIVRETLSHKHPTWKKGWQSGSSGVPFWQSWGPEFKPQNWGKRRKQETKVSLWEERRQTSIGLLGGSVPSREMTASPS
jgi:hypothetical protein